MHGTQASGRPPWARGGWGGGLGEHAMPTEEICAKMSGRILSELATTHATSQLRVDIQGPVLCS
eukprot:3719033-Prymnesium_polylepis.1